MLYGAESLLKIQTEIQKFCNYILFALYLTTSEVITSHRKMGIRRKFLNRQVIGLYQVLCEFSCLFKVFPERPCASSGAVAVDKACDD